MSEPNKLNQNFYYKGTERGVFGGGSGINVNIIQYITFNSPGNSINFGELRTFHGNLAATSNGTDERGVFGGGNTQKNIDYINITSSGISTYFGDLLEHAYYLSATSNGTNQRGFFIGGGYGGPLVISNIISYITINSVGDATDFGDLTTPTYYLSATSNGTNERGVIGGGTTGSNTNVIEYITINTLGDATDFGDLTAAKQGLAGCSNGINERGVFGGGTTGSITNVIEYITINSPGDATDFGDLTVARRYLAAASNGTNERGVFGGGTDSIDYANHIDYITINSTGDATDFGDLTTNNSFLSATSNDIGINTISIYDSTCTVDATACMDYYLTIKVGSKIGYIQMTPILIDEKASKIRVFNADTTYAILKSFSEFTYLVGEIAVCCGGMTDENPTYGINTIEYVNISTPGNATDFGDSVRTRNDIGATSNGINQRGVFIAGCGSSINNTIDYITINITSNATNFGEATQRVMFIGAFSNGTNERGVFGGGSRLTEPAIHNIIEYITINSTGNATYFGDLTVARSTLTGTSNGTNERGVFGGGTTGSRVNVIDYVTINSTGDATDFGDLSAVRTNLSATSNGTNERGVFGGGYVAGAVNTIDYITINSAGDATDFGDLTEIKHDMWCTSNTTNERGLFGGGYNGSTDRVNVIEYITINSTGNGSDFGDLMVAKAQLAATSNA